MIISLTSSCSSVGLSVGWLCGCSVIITLKTREVTLPFAPIGTLVSNLGFSFFFLFVLVYHYEKMVDDNLSVSQ